MSSTCFSSRRSLALWVAHPPRDLAAVFPVPLGVPPWASELKRPI